MNRKLTVMLALALAIVILFVSFLAHTYYFAHAIAYSNGREESAWVIKITPMILFPAKILGLTGNRPILIASIFFWWAAIFTPCFIGILYYSYERRE